MPERGATPAGSRQPPRRRWVDVLLVAPLPAAAALLARDVAHQAGGWSGPLLRARAWAAAWGDDPLPLLAGLALTAAALAVAGCVAASLRGEPPADDVPPGGPGRERGG